MSIRSINHVLEQSKIYLAEESGAKKFTLCLSSQPIAVASLIHKWISARRPSKVSDLYLGYVSTSEKYL